MTSSPESQPDDFDFLYGHWQVQHRRLVRRLAACTDWQSFGGTAHAIPLLGGAGNLDDNLIHLPGGSYRAVSLRAWDAATRQWSIWWLDGRNPTGLDVPVRGSFEGDVGTFLADDTFEGRPIRVRFQWLDTCTPVPRWEQAFSPDGGRTWETNWEMAFTRAT